MSLQEYILEQARERLVIRLDLHRPVGYRPGGEIVRASVVGYAKTLNTSHLVHFTYDRNTPNSGEGRLRFRVADSREAGWPELFDEIVNYWWQITSSWSVPIAQRFAFKDETRYPAGRYDLIGPSHFLVAIHLARMQGAIADRLYLLNEPYRSAFATTVNRLDGLFGDTLTAFEGLSATTT